VATVRLASGPGRTRRVLAAHVRIGSRRHVDEEPREYGGIHVNEQIRIPEQELEEVIKMLEEIRTAISKTASLSSVGSEDDVGDETLSSAIGSFDSAWRGGHERVQENVDTFRDAAQGIVDNFRKTDEQLGQELTKGQENPA
jgi:hypothetical protein